MEGTPLTPEEQRLRRLLLILAPVFALLGISYILQGTIAEPRAEFPFVANSAAKDGAFAVLCLIAAADLRRHSWAVGVVIGAHVLIIGSLLISLAVGNTDDVSGSFVAPAGMELPDPHLIFFLWLGLAIGVTALSCPVPPHCGPSPLRPALPLPASAPHADGARGGDRHRRRRGAHPRGSLQECGRLPLFLPGGGEVEDEARSDGALPLSAHPPPPSLPRDVARGKDRLHRDAASSRTLRTVASRSPYAAPSSRCSSRRSSSRSSATTRIRGPPSRPATSRSPSARRAARSRTWRSGRIRLCRCGSRAKVDSDRITADVVIVGSGRGRVRSSLSAWPGRAARSRCSKRGRHVDPSEFARGRAGAVRLALCGRRHADVHRRPVPGAPGQAASAARPSSTTRCASTFRTTCSNAGTTGDGFDAGIPKNEMDAAFQRLRAYMPVKRMTSSTHLAGGAVKFREGIEALGLDRIRQLRRRRGEHVGLPRLRLLQHRLPARAQALGARLHAPVASGPASRRRSRSSRSAPSSRVTPSNGSAAEVSASSATGASFA